MKDMETQLELLSRIANALDRAYPPTANLGFTAPPGRRKIFINQTEPDEDYLWYFWDGHSQQKVPILQQALTGKIVGIAIDDSQEFKGSPVEKLHLSIDADQKYKIVTGLNTFTARSIVLNTYCAYVMDSLANPITIALRRGEGTTFSTFYQSGDQLSVTWDGDVALGDLIQEIHTKLSF